MPAAHGGLMNAEGAAVTANHKSSGGDAGRAMPGYGIAPPGFRLAESTRLGRVRLQVADLPRSLDYYEQVLGLRTVDREERRAVLAPAGGDSALVELHEHHGARPFPRQGRLGLYHYAILLPDRASLGRFLAHLGTLGIRAGMSDHLVSEAIYLSDPDGLGIEVYADRPRSMWMHQAGQLAMSTDPLDVASVLAAGGSTSWEGAPAGTVLGHVHLHVGDIEQGAAFYHAGLGFDKTVWSYPGALFLSAGGYHHHLGTNTWAARAARPEADDARLLDWEVVIPVDDMEAAAESLRKAGGVVEPVETDLLARDPWGTAVRLAPAS